MGGHSDQAAQEAELYQPLYPMLPRLAARSGEFRRNDPEITTSPGRSRHSGRDGQVERQAVDPALQGGSLNGGARRIGSPQMTLILGPVTERKHACHPQSADGADCDGNDGRDGGGALV